MSEFKSEFRDFLAWKIDATPEKAERIAEMAEKMREETDLDDSPTELIERMQKRQYEDPIDSWNAVAGFLDAEYWNIGDEDGGTNPYQI